MTPSEAWEIVKQKVDEGDVEATCDALSNWFKADRELYMKTCNPHPAVLSLLECCEEDMKRVSFNFYASTK